MPLISIPTISIPGRALGGLLYYSFLSLALSARALGLLGSAIVSAPHNVEELLRELFLLSRGWNGLFCLFVLVQFCEGHLIKCILTSSTIDPEDDILNLCSPAASWVDEDLLPLSSFSSGSSTLPPSLHAGALSACGELTMGYGSDDDSLAYEEHQDWRYFDDDVSDTSSTYGEIPRDLYFNGAAAARWNSNAGLNASNASLEYELVSEDIYFDQSEAVLGIV